MLKNIKTELMKNLGDSGKSLMDFVSDLEIEFRVPCLDKAKRTRGPRVNSDVQREARNMNVIIHDSKALDDLGEVFTSEGSLFIRASERSSMSEGRITLIYLSVLSKLSNIGFDTMEERLNLKKGILSGFLDDVKDIPISEIIERLWGESPERESLPANVRDEDPFERAERMGELHALDLSKHVESKEVLGRACFKTAPRMIKDVLELMAHGRDGLVEVMFESFLANISKTLPELEGASSLDGSISATTFKVTLSKALKQFLTNCECDEEATYAAICSGLSEIHSVSSPINSELEREMGLLSENKALEKETLETARRIGRRL